jgi:hypothetical protein
MKQKLQRVGEQEEKKTQIAGIRNETESAVLAVFPVSRRK